MESVSMMAGITLMLVAAVGILLYVALVIAIPVCRALDWLFDRPSSEEAPSLSPTDPAARQR
jgi:hypothetical protein